MERRFLRAAAFPRRPGELAEPQQPLRSLRREPGWIAFLELLPALTHFRDGAAATAGYVLLWTSPCGKASEMKELSKGFVGSIVYCLVNSGRTRGVQMVGRFCCCALIDSRSRRPHRPTPRRVS